MRESMICMAMGNRYGYFMPLLFNIKLSASIAPCPRNTDFDATYKKPNSVYLIIPWYSPKAENKTSLVQIRRTIWVAYWWIIDRGSGVWEYIASAR
jgi:hypothetical protein